MVDLNELRKMLRDESMKFEEPEPDERAAPVEAVVQTMTLPLVLNKLGLLFTLRVVGSEINIAACWDGSSSISSKAAELYWPEEVNWSSASGSPLDTFFKKYLDLARSIQYAHASMLLWRMGESIGQHAYCLERGRNKGLLSEPDLILLSKGEVWEVPDFELREFKSASNGMSAADAQNDHTQIIGAISELAEEYRKRTDG